MYPHSSDGDKENNKIFSNCSNKNITRLLESIFDESKRARNKNFCFSGKKSAFCGNGIVEQVGRGGFDGPLHRSMGVDLIRHYPR